MGNFRTFLSLFCEKSVTAIDRVPGPPALTCHPPGEIFLHITDNLFKFLSAEHNDPEKNSVKDYKEKFTI